MLYGCTFWGGQTLDMKSSKPFSERVDALRELLDVTHPDLDGMCGLSASKVLVPGGWLGEAGWGGLRRVEKWKAFFKVKPSTYLEIYRHLELEVRDWGQNFVGQKSSPRKGEANLMFGRLELNCFRSCCSTSLPLCPVLQEWSGWTGCLAEMDYPTVPRSFSSVHVGFSQGLLWTNMSRTWNSKSQSVKCLCQASKVSQKLRERERERESPPTSRSTHFCAYITPFAEVRANALNALMRRLYRSFLIQVGLIRRKADWWGYGFPTGRAFGVCFERLAWEKNLLKWTSCHVRSLCTR